MGMTTMLPTWLYYLFGVLMCCVAGYSTLLLAMAARSRRFVGWDVELSHLLMGVAMAGMFVSGWSFGPSAMWELFFGALLVWFVLRAGRSVLAYGVHLPHTAVHALMSLAMLIMYWFPMGAQQQSVSMSMSSSAIAPRADPGLLLVIAFVLLVSAVFTLASERKGAAVYGTHVALTANGGATLSPVDGRAAPCEASLAGTMSSAEGLEGLVSSPWLLDATHAVMCVAMGFLLILML